MDVWSCLWRPDQDGCLVMFMEAGSRCMFGHVYGGWIKIDVWSCLWRPDQDGCLVMFMEDRS